MRVRGVGIGQVEARLWRYTAGFLHEIHSKRFLNLKAKPPELFTPLRNLVPTFMFLKR